MKKILIVSLSDPARDPRVIRQLRSLSKQYEVAFFGRGRLDIQGVKWYSAGSPQPPGSSLLRRFFWALLDGSLPLRIVVRALTAIKFIDPKYGALVRLLVLKKVARFGSLKRLVKAQKFDLILANDLSGLALAGPFHLSSRILYDAHEYSPGQKPSSSSCLGYRAYVDMVLRRYLARCASVMTVAEGIAQEYQRVFGIKKPMVVLNAPLFSDLSPSKLSRNTIRLVHHGICSRSRSLDIMVDAVKSIGPRFTLDLYLLPRDKVYLAELQNASAGFNSITFHDPVPTERLPEELNQFDLGIAFFPPLTFNLEHALPNKFFEYVQARLSILIGPSPEMVGFVRNYEIGIVARGFEAADFKDALRDLDISRIEIMKNNTMKAALDLTGEGQIRSMLEIVQSLIA